MSAIMRTALEWPMSDAGFAQVFHTFGTEGGSFAAVRNDATHAIPKNSDLAGRPRTAVLFMRRMPMLAWLSMTITGASQQLEIGLLGNRALTEKVPRTLGDHK